MLPFVLWQGFALAQGLPVSQDPAINTPQWQLTLDVIKAKAQVLIESNNKLMEEHNYLVEEKKKLKQGMSDWQTKNESLRQSLKERHGRSDQQVHMDDMTEQMKAKKLELKNQTEELARIQEDATELDRKIRLKTLKISQPQLKQKEQALQASAQKQLEQRSTIENNTEFNQLKEKLQQEKDQEKALETQLQKLKKAKPAPVLADPDVGEIKSLQEKIKTLRKQKEDLQKKINADNNQAKVERFKQLSSKKQELEDKIKHIEDQLNDLRSMDALGQLGKQRQKQTLHRMIQVDSRNAQMRQKISDLHEDVAVLKEQINRLERKLQFTQGSF